MELSIYLGQIFSVMFVVVGLALLLRPKHYIKAYKSWMSHYGLMLFTSMVMIIAGTALVIAHNIWIVSWEVLITIIGWGTIFKAVFLLFLPKEFEKLVELLLKKSWIATPAALIWLIGGAYMGYFAWFV